MTQNIVVVEPNAREREREVGAARRCVRDNSAGRKAHLHSSVLLDNSTNTAVGSGINLKERKLQNKRSLCS